VVYACNCGCNGCQEITTYSDSGVTPRLLVGGREFVHFELVD
jgi:hypothetical protein